MRKLRKSFGHAANGLRETLIHERNFKIMLGMVLYHYRNDVLLAHFARRKSHFSTTIFAVLTLEMVNIVIERLLDFLHPAHHEEVRIIKDLMTPSCLSPVLAPPSSVLMIFWYIFFKKEILFFQIIQYIFAVLIVIP